MLIRDAEIDGQRCDLRIAGAHIAAIAPALAAQPAEPIVDAHGGALIPGLHDHHIHLDATAAALSSVRCGPPEVHSRGELALALAAAPGNGWLRGVGYHDSIGSIDRTWLDTHGPTRPVRIQHRGGRMWVLNSAAIAALGGDWPTDGRLIDGDQLLADRLGRKPPDLDPVGAVLARHGVTGLTEVTPRNTAVDRERYRAEGLPQHLLVMGDHSLDRLPGTGAVKLHYHDHDLPALDLLTMRIATAHAAGRPVAAHCVTLAELLLTLAAIDEAGAHPGDRIEHASLAPPDAIDMIVRLGCTVVTQPHFLSERAAAYHTEVELRDQPWLYRLRGFLAAGVPLAAGSDAPFGGVNPWAAMAAAVTRPTGFGRDEALTPEEALALYLGPLEAPGGPARRIAIGAPADLCLLPRPWSAMRGDLAAVVPVMTMISGQAIYSSATATSAQARA